MSSSTWPGAKDGPQPGNAPHATSSHVSSSILVTFPGALSLYRERGEPGEASPTRPSPRALAPGRSRFDLPLGHEGGPLHQALANGVVESDGLAAVAAYAFTNLEHSKVLGLRDAHTHDSGLDRR